MKRLVVDVERLVLRGVPYPHRHAVARALRAELARLLAGPEAPSRIASAGEALSARPLRAAVAPDATPAQLGRAMAGAIGNRLGRGAK